MSATAAPSSLIHRLRRRGRWGWLLALCWLFLNAQLAVAGHRCDLSVVSAPPVIQHQQHMIPAAGGSHHSPTPETFAQQAPLCEKHCVSETSKQDNVAPPLLALPVSAELTLAFAPQQTDCDDSSRLSPSTSGGPPAEIRFCRFRE